MNFIDYFTWFVLFVTIVCFIVVFVFMGMWPGMVASQRNHPQVDAIKIGSWVTLILGFALWPLVLIWAYARPIGSVGADKQAERVTQILNQKITLLETRITQLESAQGDEK